MRAVLERASTERSGEHSGEPATIGAAIGTLIDRGALERMHARQVDALAEQIVARVRPVEATHQVAGDDRLRSSAARRIALGVCEAPDGTPQELERLLGSLGEVEAFSSSPAAYLMGAAQRRRWVD